MMKIIIIFLSQLVIGIISEAPVGPCPVNQFQYNGFCQPLTCLNYMQRIRASAFYDGIVPLNNKGSISNNCVNVTVVFEFKDIQNDGTFQADNPTSCIRRTLLRTNAAYQTLGLNELPITSTYDPTSGYRIWKFTLTPSQYAAIAFPFVDTITGLTWYQGFFGYQITIANTTQSTEYFTFKFAVNSTTGATSGNATFIFLTTDQQLDCVTQSECVTSINATMGFTTSLSTAGCGSAFSNITSYLNANLFICYSLPLQPTWTLTNPFVYITGTNIFLQVNIVNVVYSKGIMVLQVNLPFVYNDVAIQVTATAVPSDFRPDWLGFQNFDDLLGTPSSSITQLGCIKVSENSTSCPTTQELAQYPPTADSVGIALAKSLTDDVYIDLPCSTITYGHILLFSLLVAIFVFEKFIYTYKF